MKFFQVYQYAAPLVLLPLGWWLWWLRFHDHRLVAVALSFPIVFAYVIPALGTNWLRLWEFNTRLRLGRFRPHHGFVFGSATSLLAIAALPLSTGAPTLGGLLQSAFVLGSVLAFWNWLYDGLAIRAGYISIHTRLAHEGADAETVAGDYAPIFFGVFGACYAVVLRLVEWRLCNQSDWDSVWWLVPLGHAACLLLPVAGYMMKSWVVRREIGLRSYEGIIHEA
jgi:hypothetical protein